MEGSDLENRRRDVERDSVSRIYTVEVGDAVEVTSNAPAANQGEQGVVLKKDLILFRDLVKFEDREAWVPSLLLICVRRPA